MITVTYMKSKFIICFFLNLVLLYPLFSQEKEKVDSLLKESKTILNSKKAMSMIDKALRIARSIEYQDGILRSELSKIIIYFDNYDNKECINGIENIEKDILKSKNYTLIALMEQIKGLVYLRLHLPSMAKTQFNSALFFSDKIVDADERHHRKGFIYLGMASLNDDTEIKDYRAKVLKCLKKAYQEFSLLKNKDSLEGLIVTCNTLGSYYSNTGNFTFAKFYFNKAIALSKKSACTKCLTYSWNRAGNMYKNMKDYNSAIKNYEKSIKISDSIGDIFQLQLNYRDLSEVYEKTNNIEKQKESLKMLKIITDSISNKKNLALGAVINGITRDIKSEHEKNTNHLKLYILIGSIGCALLSYIVFMYFKKYRLEKENSKKLEKFLNEKTIFIQSLSSSKSIIDKEEELKTVIRMAMTNDVLFFQTFNELFPDFKKKLMQLDPFFRANDLKFCCYLKLNFDTKEIARYTGDSVRSVESKKYRLRKKFNISSQEDMNAWVSNL